MHVYEERFSAVWSLLLAPEVACGHPLGDAPAKLFTGFGGRTEMHAAVDAGQARFGIERIDVVVSPRGLGDHAVPGEADLGRAVEVAQGLAQNARGAGVGGRVLGVVERGQRRRPRRVLNCTPFAQLCDAAVDKQDEFGNRVRLDHGVPPCRPVPLF